MGSMVAPAGSKRYCVKMVRDYTLLGLEMLSKGFPPLDVTVRDRELILSAEVETTDDVYPLHMTVEAVPDMHAIIIHHSGWPLHGLAIAALLYIAYAAAPAIVTERHIVVMDVHKDAVELCAEAVNRGITLIPWELRGKVDPWGYLRRTRIGFLTLIFGYEKIVSYRARHPVELATLFSSR